MINCCDVFLNTEQIKARIYIRFISEKSRLINRLIINILIFDQMGILVRMM